jgi:hypothetical protein
MTLPRRRVPLAPDSKTDPNRREIFWRWSPRNNDVVKGPFEFHKSIMVLLKTLRSSFQGLRARPELVEGTNGELVEITSVHAELVEAFLEFFSRINTQAKPIVVIPHRRSSR